MSKWQERHAAGATAVELRVDAIDDVACQVVASEHHALAEAGGAAGVVDFHELVVVAIYIVDAGGSETLGIGLRHQVVDFLKHVAGSLALLLGKQGAVVERDGGADVSHVVEVKRLPNAVAGIEQLGLAVVDDVLCVAGVELLQDGDNHGAVGDGANVYSLYTNRIINEFL